MRRAAVTVALVLVSACASRGTTPAPSLPENRAEEAPPARPAVADGPVTAESVKALIGDRFADQVAAGRLVLELGPSDGVAEDVLSEVRAMGIETVAQLDAVIPGDYATRAAHVFSPEAEPANAAGVVRDFLMIHDLERYFAVAHQDHWDGYDEALLRTLDAYGVDPAPVYDHLSAGD